jgi:hypothetical protein
MKKRVSQIISLGIALAALPAVQAQDHSMKANVPFDFYVGDKAMPQGAYRVDATSNRVIAWVQGMDQDATKAIVTANITDMTRPGPKLVFHRYGEDYFLAEIWTGETSIGQYLPRSRREKELARGGAAHTLAVIQVALHR